jgi:hypothetical protein
MRPSCAGYDAEPAEPRAHLNLILDWAMRRGVNLTKEHIMLRRLLLSLPLLAISSLAPAYAQNCNTVFTLTNRANRSVTIFYYDTVSNTGWSPNRLEGTNLPPGASRRFVPRFTTNYKFRAVLADGRAFELYDINPCRISEVTVNDGRLIAR